MVSWNSSLPGIVLARLNWPPISAAASNNVTRCPRSAATLALPAWALLEATLGEDGFVNDIYSKDYALVNRVADRQRYEAIFAARHSVQPQERHYAQYRAVCLQPTSRYSEPNNWKACVLAPIQEAVTGTAPLDEAIQTAVTNWNRERVE